MRPISTNLRHGFAGVAGFLLLFVMAVQPARAAVDIQKVVSEKGITAWLVEDYTVPLIAVRFAFRGGSTQDPAGKEGLANLMSGLFDEGAGDLDRTQFQDRLDEAGAEMGIRAGYDSIGGSMRMLAETRKEAFDVLRLAVTEPRFDDAPVARIKAQIVSSIDARSRDPQTEASRAWARAIYGDHPYSRRDEGTKESLATITRDDLVAAHEHLFARDNLVIGVVGAIDAETLKSELDRVFGDLPAHARLDEIGPAAPRLDQDLHVDHALPQATIRLAYPGVERSDPGFFAAYLMNHILGGGTFSSRLFSEVREKRGLSYGINSMLVNRDHSSMLAIETSTRADRAEETLNVILDEVRRMAEEGPSAEELRQAKDFVLGAYAINNLDSSAAIARTLVQLQTDDLGIDYIARREALIEAVTLEEVREQARRLLQARPAVMVVGPAAEE
ncbi:M16 family metallopeptidase [Mesorhizobium xinjiangense]|uniref:M16 family metallopeptidase n=1 Tax=Mesorhizobium xinjiangense TaxID=2678685 RepID=UPI0012EDDA08|nr:pitrilysin family protein [Mesorhizobium xinjiangense]